MIGEKSAMACTIAVEELIGNHYNNQIKQLVDDDPVVHAELLKVLFFININKKFFRHYLSFATKNLSITIQA